MDLSISHQAKRAFAPILQGTGVPIGPGARYVLACVVFLGALISRFVMLPVEAGLGFLTFYPAVALCALLFGTGPGVLTTALGASAAYYFFMPPYGAFKLVGAHVLAAATFTFSGFIICFLTHQMRRRTDELKVAMGILEKREHELAQANQRLEKLDRIKTDFFANVSHEFRTPLTLMLGPLETLLDDCASAWPVAQRQMLEMVHRNGTRLQRLVNALLDFSRIEADNATPCWVDIDLASFTEELASHFNSACLKAGLKLVIDCEPKGQRAIVDQSMWEKILLNLLSNAFKFTFSGAIEVRLRSEANEAILTIRDSGGGIPSNELPHIFERFHRVQGVRGRSVEGSGIGLALTSELVRLHGGSITVVSEEGDGSTFTVRIPANRRDLNVAFGRQPDVVGVHTQAVVNEVIRWLPEVDDPCEIDAIENRGWILLADDNQDMRVYVARLLASAGYRVTTVNDGDAVLLACQSELPDVVVTDVMMPGLDGFGVLKHLRSNPATSTLPVILLSARAGEEARIEGLGAGADDYLVKPFGSRELIARVDGVIRLARIRLEAQQRLVHYMGELERSNQALADFAYIASHDLKEPLRGLHNYASFLRDDYGICLDDQGKAYLDSMQRLVLRLTALIDGLLHYSRVGSTELSLTDVALDPVLDEVIEDLKPLLTEQGVELLRPNTLPVVSCDALRVREVFQNLITNAVKYNDKTAKQIEIGCTSATPPVFYVRDNGIGIRASHQDSIFRIFKRLHEREKYGDGTGVGLTIVKKIIERHGGRVWLESTEGRGSTFFFTLSEDVK